MKTKLAFIMAVHLIFSIVIISCSKSPENVSIKLNLEPGKTYSFNVNMEKEIYHQIKDHPKSKITTTYNYNTHIDVVSFSNNTYELTIKQNNLKVTYSNPYHSFSYPQNKLKKLHEVPPEIVMLMILDNFPIDIKIDSKGRLISFKGLNQAVEKFIKDSEISEFEKELIKEAVKKISPDTARFAIFPFYPDRPVYEGYSWSVNKSLKDLPAKITVNYKVTEIDKDSVKITLNAIIKGKSGKKDLYRSEFSGEQKGYLIVDRKTGLVIESKTKQIITIETNSFHLAYPIKTTVKTEYEIHRI